MPLDSAPTTLEAMIQPVKQIHDAGECRVDITPDTVRIRSVSQGKAIALDHSLPLTDQTVAGAPADFWITVDRVSAFLDTRSTGSVRITFPFETTDGRLVLNSDGLTYRFAPFFKRAKHKLVSFSHQEPPTVCSLQHKDFVRSLVVADLVADKLTLEFCSGTHRITFSATGDNGDSFTYSPRVEAVEAVGESTAPLTIGTDKLTDLMSLIAGDCLGTLELTPDFLTYRVEHPIPGAELTVHIARYKQAVY
jgi:hypothetical protein